ncbi:MAG: hypothetical protein ACT4OZ_15005 [Gemmatimonadota bacterium]
MTFDISFTESTDAASLWLSEELEGAITLGSYIEGFSALLTAWSPSDYQRSWRENIEWVLRTRQPGYLVTCLMSPDISEVHIEWWLLYPFGDVVAVQNSLLFPSREEQPVNLADLKPYIPPRRLYSMDGDVVSEWSVPESSLKAFLAMQG